MSADLAPGSGPKRYQEIGENGKEAEIEDDCARNRFAVCQGLIQRQLELKAQPEPRKSTTISIIAQRAFEANSKAVTTFDTITQETINMIH